MNPISGEVCEFCGRDPYHYVDIGVGFEAVAITCCSEKVEQHYKAMSDYEQKRNNRLLSQDNQPE